MASKRPQTNRTKIPQFLEQYWKITQYKIELIEYVFYLFKHHGHYTSNTDLEKLVKFIKWCKSYMVANEKYTDDFIRKFFVNGATHLNHESIGECREVFSDNGVNMKKFRKYASELSKFRSDIYMTIFSDILLFEHNERIRYKKELFDAAQCGDCDTVLRIMGNRHSSISDSDIDRSLRVAIWNECNDVAYIIIQYKIILNNYYMPESLNVSVIHNNYSMIESLIDLRVNVDNYNNYNYYNYVRSDSALYIASKNCSNVNIIELLINSKANVNITDVRYRQTPLHIATKNRSIEIVKRLLDAKSDFNAISCELGPNTPLQIAQVNGYDEILRLFR
jgi:ankyrin repeat protein